MVVERAITTEVAGRINMALEEAPVVAASLEHGADKKMKMKQ